MLRGVEVDPAAWAEQLAPLVHELGEALADLLRDRMEAGRNLAAKQAALADFDRTVPALARLVEAHLAAAGLPEFADQVRPRRLRPRRRKAPGEVVEAQPAV